MILSRALHGRLLRPAFVLALLAPAATLAAQSKDTIRLQTQLQELQDSVARMQQSNDERMGVLKDLVQQSADSVNRMSLTVNGLSKQLADAQTVENTKVDQVSGQVQAINDSLDEIKARMARVEKTLAAIDSQQQATAAALNNLPAASSAPTPSVPAAAVAPTPADTAPPAAAKPKTNVSNPPADQLYKTAYSDYMQAKYSVATSEFNDVIHAYPDHALAGNSWYYLGEIDYRAGKYAVAAKDYDKVLEQFPDSNKIPAAHLHKGQALLALKQNDAAIRELRALIQRFPTSPEAAQARSRLSGLGVPAKPRT